MGRGGSLFFSFIPLWFYACAKVMVRNVAFLRVFGDGADFGVGNSGK